MYFGAAARQLIRILGEVDELDSFLTAAGCLKDCMDWLIDGHVLWEASGKLLPAVVEAGARAGEVPRKSQVLLLLCRYSIMLKMKASSEGHSGMLTLLDLS